MEIREQTSQFSVQGGAGVMENEVEILRAENDRLARELEAAKRDMLHFCPGCKLCKYFNQSSDDPPCDACQTGIRQMYWQWRGATENGEAE